MYCKCITAMIAALVSVAGCTKDYSLSPPTGSEMVTVIIKVPQGIVPKPMQVMYRSALCKRVSRGASGQLLEREGYHGVDVPLHREGLSNKYSASLSVDGGGNCEWRLSNVTLGVAYSDLTSFGEGVIFGGGAGIIVKFDNNRPSIGAGFQKKIDGDVVLKKEYYPWLSESFLDGNKKYISLVGEGDIYTTYQACRARKIYFELALHSGFLVSSVQPRVHRKGSYTTFTYPDGSVVSDGRASPDFRRLQTIRLGGGVKGAGSSMD